MNVFDISASIIIVFCIASAFKYRWIWLLYAIGGLGISIVDFKIGLWGQATMNFILFLLAVKNFIFYKHNYETKR